MDQHILTIPETAALLKVTRVTLTNWRRSGAGPPFVVMGTKSIRYRRQDVESWLESLVVTRRDSAA